MLIGHLSRGVKEKAPVGKASQTLSSLLLIFMLVKINMVPLVNITYFPSSHQKNVTVLAKHLRTLLTVKFKKRLPLMFPFQCYWAWLSLKNTQGNFVSDASIYPKSNPDVFSPQWFCFTAGLKGVEQPLLVWFFIRENVYCQTTFLRKLILFLAAWDL